MLGGIFLLFLQVSVNPAYGSPSTSGEEALEEYVEVFQQAQEEGGEMEGKEGDDVYIYSEIPNVPMKKYDSSTYNETVEEFLLQKNGVSTVKGDLSVMRKERNVGERGAGISCDTTEDMSISAHQERPEYSNSGKDSARAITTVDLGSKPPLGVGGTSPSHAGNREAEWTNQKKGSPLYVNDIDEIAREMKKASGESHTKRQVSGTGKTPPRPRAPLREGSKVTLLSTALEDQFCDEDEDGYTLYDPKRAAGRKGTTGARQQKGDYQNSPVGSMARHAGSDDTDHDHYKNAAVLRASLERERTPEEPHSPFSGKPQPYVNDLIGLAAAAKLGDEGGGGERGRAGRMREREQRGSVGARHHPYVNDVAKLMQEALGDDQIGREEMERSLEAPPDGEREGEREGVGGTREKRHNYVNDLAELLPPVGH